LGVSLPSAQAPATPPTPPPAVAGIIVPGDNFAAKWKWLEDNARNNSEYIIEVSANEYLRPQAWFSGRTNVTIHLKGVGTIRTINISANGSLFTIPGNNTLVLDENIILRGKSDNNAPLVLSNGTLIMNVGSTIAGNYINSWGVNGGGVSGTVIMNGGTISDNKAASYGNGGGVYTNNEAFTKTGGTITSFTDNPTSGNAVKNSSEVLQNNKGHAVYVNSNVRKETTAGPGVKLYYPDPTHLSESWENY